MKPKEYGTVSRPASVGVVGEVVYGIFYHDRMRHIATYVPGRRPPRDTLCNRKAGVPDREIGNLCPDCVAAATQILGELHFV